MPWIKLHSELWDSWKVQSLADKLGICEAQAVGHLVSLWCFVERNKWDDGDLTKWGAKGVARAARWDYSGGVAEDFVQALCDCGFIDEGTLKVHEWEKHQAAMIHDRARRNPREIPAESPLNPCLDKMREDKRREEKKEEKKMRFAPPKVDEVAAYIQAQSYPVDATRFVAYYESNGWKVGRNPMKCWKAAVRTWATKAYGERPANRAGDTSSPISGKYANIGEKANGGHL